VALTVPIWCYLVHGILTGRVNELEEGINELAVRHCVSDKRDI